MNKMREFIYNYKITITIVLLLMASFFVYLFVSANEDMYENQIEVTNTKIDIIDGTKNNDGNFDSNDEAGNDSSDKNKIVRNFDQITYNISYGLKYKDDSTLNDDDKSLDVTRDVIIDILVPDGIYMEICESDIMNVLSKEFTIEGDTSYNYYKIEINNAHMSETNTTEIIFNKINGKNGNKISPIIRVREKTDNPNTKNITEVTDVSSIDKINIDDITISAVDNYGIELYQGVKKENSDYVTDMPLGILVYIPNDSNKGIKGVQIPDEINFNLNIESTSSTSNVLEDLSISNYASDSDFVVSDMPYSYTSKNGKSSISNINYLNQNRNSNISIKFTELSFNKNTQMTTLSNNKDVYYLSTKVFVFKSQRSQNDKSDISYNITTNSSNSNQINDYLDNYVTFIGDFKSEIGFFNSATSTDEQISLLDTDAIYNYNEEFYIQNTINYGTKKGDNLENGFTNYIKIDNTAIRLEALENASDQSLDYYLQIGSTSGTEYNPTIKYGLGDWNASNFKLKNNRPSYCPSSLNNVSKEDLMNMYGGPCIEDNNIQWVDSIQDAIDNNKGDKIILFKLEIPEEYSTGVQTIVRLKARMVKNYSNIGKTFEIVSRGQTTYNSSIYYLSESPKISVDRHSQDMKYNKTQYDSNYNIIGGNNTIVNGESVTNIGNTILVSPFKATIKNIELHDVYNSIGKTTFYSGMTDPIEFVINPVIYKSDYEATIQGATISVYLPESLEIYEIASDKKYNRTTSGNTVTIDGVNYIEYNYDYSESDINFENESVSGTIPNLHVHAYITIATADNTNVKVISRISGKLKTNESATTTYNDVSSIERRTNTVSLTLRNIKNINSIGKVNSLNIDKNGSYQYNMRAANSSNDSVDISLLYILPYSGDGIGNGSEFSGNISISILDSLPSGYKAYYTKDNAKVLLNNEINNSSSTNWIQWTNINTKLSGITAIKIIPSSVIPSSNYFASKNGITFDISTKGNKESEKYYNNFYIIQKNADVCIDDDNTGNCTITEKKTVSYSSNISEISVYNRKISGYAFEDSNYNGFYDSNEPRLKNIAVDLYRLNATSFDSKNPIPYISDQDQLISDGDVITDNKGYYSFEGLESGNYYAKYTFDCNKYTVTEKNKVDTDIQGDASTIDSDAQIIETDSDDNDNKVCYAISNILTLNNDVIEHSHIDLGLRLRQDFDIKLKKYITNVKVISNGNIVQNNNYKNETKVKIDVRNLKNTSFKVTYGIEIENTKYFPGTIGNIIETIPEGMTFNPNLQENDGWYESDGNLYYSYLNKSLLMPGEKYYLTIVLDLTTDNGGDYINFVAANDLKIKPVITNFLEIPEDTIVVEDDLGGDE